MDAHKSIAKPDDRALDGGSGAFLSSVFVISRIGALCPTLQP